jgi:hypothetical protein
MSLTSVRVLCAALTLLPAFAAADHPSEEAQQIAAGGEVLGAHDGWA